MDPLAFHARVLAHADAEGRLPTAAQPTWPIFPFEPDALRVKPLDPLTLPEPPRGGAGGRGCRPCADPLHAAVWADERWVLRGAFRAGLPSLTLTPRGHFDLDDLDDALAGDLGQLTVRISRALHGLGGVGRVHVNKWGDGGEHLHVIFLVRPAGMLQLRGSNLPLWEEMLPRLPVEELAASYSTVADALADWRGEAIR
jgi:hypothetical protein